MYLSNSDNGSALGLEFFGAVSSVYDWPVFRTVLVERAAQPVAVLKSLIGRYEFKEGPAISVVFEQSALTLVFPNGDRCAMTPIFGVPLAFIHPHTAVRASFDGEGADMTIQLYGDTGRRVATAE